MLSRLIYLPVLLSLCSVPLCRAEPVPVKAEVPKILLKQYLPEAGAKLDCYFTIEEDRTGNGGIISLGNTKVSDRAVGTVRLLVEELKQELPNATVWQSETSPKVIHIVAITLNQDKSYVMAQNLNFTFTGVLGDMPDRLGSQTGGRIGSRPFFYEGEAFDDFITSVSIKSQNTAVRDLLTDFIPLSNYHRILWTSETHHAEGKFDTWVQYYGPVPTQHIR